MKAISNSQLSPLTARTLKLVGVILILSFLLDFVMLLFPFKPLDEQWQVNFATNLVNRGVIPMIGLALLFTGDWINNSVSDSPPSRKAPLGLKFWALLLSSLLGLLFLVLCPLHLNNVSQASAQTTDQINKKAAQAETELQAKLGNPQAQAEIEQQQNQVKSQIKFLLKDEQQLNQVLQSDKVPPQFKDLLKQAKANPTGVDQLVQQQLNVEAIRKQLQTQIQRNKLEAEEKATQEAWQSSVRTGISSLVLAVGYILIGWTGLRSMGVLQPGNRKPAAY